MTVNLMAEVDAERSHRNQHDQQVAEEKLPGYAHARAPTAMIHFPKRYPIPLTVSM